MTDGQHCIEKSSIFASFILVRRLVVVFSEITTSLAMSDISVLASKNSKHFIILKSVSLRLIDSIRRSKMVTLTTVAGLGDDLVFGQTSHLMVF